MAAFRMAFERGDRAIELDVHLTADEELLVCHDPDTLRTTGTKQVIRESCLQDLSALDAGSWKGRRWAGEKLPSLDRVLAELPAEVRCFIEIKVGPEAVPALEKLVRRHDSKDAQLVIISFEASTIGQVKRRLPYLEAHLLAWFERQADADLVAHQHDRLCLVDRRPADWASTMSPWIIPSCMPKLSGLALYAWTVDRLAARWQRSKIRRRRHYHEQGRLDAEQLGGH